MLPVPAARCGHQGKEGRETWQGRKFAQLVRRDESPAPAWENWKCRSGINPLPPLCCCTSVNPWDAGAQCWGIFSVLGAGEGS